LATFKTTIDHIAVGASTLAAGVEYIQSELGVEIPFGGVHTAMATHNHVMRLGDSLFLEVIATNPEGEPATQPRWFGLDDPAVRAKIAGQPQLLTWVARTTDLEAAMANAASDYGVVQHLSRNDLRWSFAMPQDGRLLAAGMLPYLMQWSCDTHPAQNMAERNCRLTGLAIRHPYPQWLESQLQSIGALDAVTIEAAGADTLPCLSATIDTPGGTVVLSSS
jgi:hypothetical protein